MDLLIQRIHHFAVDVELQLRARGVADAHRPRAAIAREPRHLPFHQPALACQAVQRLDLCRRAGDAAPQPGAPGLRLLAIAGMHQREQRERGIAQPAIAVVPVALAAGQFGQRGGRGSDDAAGRIVGERLQRQQRAHHLIAPFALVQAARRPRRPSGVDLIQRRQGIRRHRIIEMRLAMRQGERDALPGRDGELADGGELLAAQLRTAVQHHDIGPGNRAQPRVALQMRHPRHRGAVIEPQRQVEPHRRPGRRGPRRCAPRTSCRSRRS